MDERQRVTEYIQGKYSGEIEYLWMRHPTYGAFRHQDNQKWYALLMRVPREKLGLAGDDSVEVLNVKVDDLLYRDLLLQRPGFLPGYHMQHGYWISVLLDGSVPFEELCGLIDMSFRVTASTATKKVIRPPKEWLIPSNLKYFDTTRAFEDTDEITWKQGKGMKTGDTVFLYVGVPVSAILFRCEVVEADIPWTGPRDEINTRTIMRIRVTKRYDPNQFTFAVLNRDYAIFAVRGPRGVPRDLSEALK